MVLARLYGAAGLGVFLGAAAAGGVHIATGRAFAHGSQWLIGLPVLTVLGAAAGVSSARITRRWLAPAAPYRRLLFTVAGLLTLPLAIAVAQGKPSAAVVFPLFLGGVALTVTPWVRSFRRETALARSRTYRRAVRR